MGMSLLYEVLEPLPDAHAALARARGLLAEFADYAEPPYSPDLGPVVTADQFRHSLRYFSRGWFTPRSGGPFPPEGLPEFWALLHRTNTLLGGDTYAVEVALHPDMADLWPLIEAWELELQLPFAVTPPFARTTEDGCTEEELDAMVAALGPLGFDVAWYADLRGLPSTKLCGVHLALNSAWTSQCTEPAPGSHAVYLSVGTRNHATQDAWLAATGLRLGPPLTGW
ncbi:hypothetical protein V2S66_29440 [Streptomyces sp. V4-01]|uniref:Uncharacterized protein n=1 Tax=Actinacidiphila polyblastidii TaxID=3110430 RepID=A0ABU7PJR4_9ACTN|nr:hypothetical protein [Streptomyces sp. V4-01]